MTGISRRLVSEFVMAAADRLAGDWVIIGGAVLPLVGIETRVTVDIDLAGPDSSTQRDVLILMDIAGSLGLPVEAVNQAGAHFLHKIVGWETSLVPVHKGKKGRFFRPDVTLFVRLKIVRLSEVDLEDCLAFLEFAQRTGEAVDRKKLRTAIKTQLRNAEAPRRIRLRRLDEILSTRVS